MQRRTFLRMMGMAGGYYLATQLTCGYQPCNSRPNIVIIVADDLGWDDVGYNGSDIPTPNIDRLAQEGRALDRFYTCPVCSPTRAGLMTGRYPIRYGMMRSVITPWRNYGLPADEITLPQVLKKAGYRHRSIFGKWHLGHSRLEYHPLKRGFTHFYGHYNGALDYFTHLREGERDWQLNYQPCDDKGYTTDLIADAASDFIKSHADQGPFFCYVPFNAPHTPFQAPEKTLLRFEHLRENDGKNRYQYYTAMVFHMDDGIGRILKALDEKGITNKTLVLFFSDNGRMRGLKKNGPLRGWKISVFEGGIRTPAAVRWPECIKPGEAITAPVAYIDILPTLMRIVGVPDHGGKPLDGMDVFDVLRGHRSQLERDLFFYNGEYSEKQEGMALITPEWKLVCNGPNILDRNIADTDRNIFLFRIEEDLGEKHDLSKDFPDVVREMMSRLRTFRALQPEDGVTPHFEGREGFVPPKDWRIPGSLERSSTG